MRRFNRSDHAHHIHRFGDIVHTQNMCALGQRQSSQCQATVEATANFVTEHLADHALARDTNQQGPPQRRELTHAPEQGEIVLQGLGKTKARIEQDPLSGNTGCRADSHALDEKVTHLSDDIRILRIILHVAGLTAHMHQTHRQTSVCRRIQSAITQQRTHIIDQARTQPCTFAHDCRRRGIHGNDHVKLTGDGFDHRRDPLQLLGRRNASRPRAGGFTTDIDQRRACGDHLLGVTQRSIAHREAPTVGKGIGGDIEDAHHLRTGQIKKPATTGQPAQVLRLRHMKP